MRNISNPAAMLHATLTAQWKLMTVPLNAAARSNAVDSRCHQLLAVESTAYGLIASSNSLPVRMRIVESGTASDGTLINSSAINSVVLRCYCAGVVVLQGSGQDPDGRTPPRTDPRPDSRCVVGTRDASLHHEREPVPRRT